MNLNELFNHPVVNLDKQVRFSNLKIMFPENVAEHSEIVANIAMILALEFRKQGADIDLKDIAYRSVIHDWPEAVTCDVTSDVKYSSRELFKALESYEKLAFAKLGFDDDFDKDVAKAKSENVIESRLVEIADRFSALFKIAKEYMYQRTQYFKSSLLNGIEGNKKTLLRCIEDYPFTAKLFNEFIKDLDAFKEVILEKKDFL